MSRPLLLLDTCAALWFMDGTPLRAKAARALDEAGARGDSIFVSPITGWEIGLQASRGRFKSNYTPQRWLSVLLSRPQVALAEMPPHVLLEASLLPDSPLRDPADRIIAATAREFGFAVVTRDAALLDYAQAGYLSALEC